MTDSMMQNVLDWVRPAQRDVIQAVIGDPHIGSNHALFVDRFWEGLNKNNHTPTSQQLRIMRHFYTYADELANARVGKRLVLVLMGDLLEGVIHGTNETWTNNMSEMADVAIEIIADFQRRVNWSRGDKLYCLRGTYSHSEDWEEKIGEQLNAIPDKAGNYSRDILEFEENGVNTICVHHGATAGTGANEGNSEVNWLRANVYNYQRELLTPPDIIYSAHVHKPTYAVHAWRKKWVSKVMHGVIVPSWKMKDRYTAKVSRIEFNHIGGMYQLITGDGIIAPPTWCIMDGDV